MIVSSGPLGVRWGGESRSCEFTGVCCYFVGPDSVLMFTVLREIAHTQPSFEGPMGGGKFRQLEDGIICNERAHRREGSQFCLRSGG